jgi:thioredoxin 1
MASESTTGFQVEQPTRDEIDGRRGPLVLEFGTDWCGYCIAAKRFVDEALADRPDVPLLQVEDGPGRPLGRSFRVKLWPTLVFLRDGQEVARVVRPTATGPLREALAALDAVGGRDPAPE